jgi:hypothetical protein
MTACECPAAGFCQRYKRVQVDHHWQICQGAILSTEQQEQYRKNWATLAAGAKPKPNKRSKQTPQHGPGTELKKLLAELGITNFAGCGCGNKMRQMNRWGVEGCRENFATIRGWIAEAQAKAGWLATITAATRAATTGLALRTNPRDIPGSLVHLAIERAAQRNTTTEAAP